MPNEDYSKILRFYGLEVRDDSPGDQYRCNSPFAPDRKGRFYMDPETGQWDCKVSGETGNIYTLITLLSELAPVDAEDLYDYRTTKTPGLPKRFKSALEHDCVALNRNNPSAFYLALHKYNKEKNTFTPTAMKKCDLSAPKPTWMNAPLYKPQPFLPAISREYIESGKPIESVTIVEGEWDALLLAALWAKKPQRIIVSFKASLSKPYELFQHLTTIHPLPDIRIVFDADDSGRKQAEKLQQHFIKHYSYAPQIAHWPEDTPKGYDISDALCKEDSPFAPAEVKKLPATCISLLEELLSATKDADLGDSPEATTTNADDDEPQPSDDWSTHYLAEVPKPAQSLSELATAFEENGVVIDQDFIDAMAFTMATLVASQSVRMTPVWAFLIGPPSSGKSLILDAACGDPKRTAYQTTIDRAALMSGFTGAGDDPSLIPKLINPPKTLVVKDFTTVITRPKAMVEEVFGLLRECFDGDINKRFGNAQHRVYNGRFGMISGVTPKIHTYSDTDLGPRMLKYDMRTNARAMDDLVLAALDDAEEDLVSRTSPERRAHWVHTFHSILQTPYEPPSLSSEEKLRLASLAHWIAYSRAVVERDKDYEDLLYEAQTETPVRAAKQLKRLLYSAARVFLAPGPIDHIPEAAWRITARCAWDTAFSRDRNMLSDIALNHDKGVDRSRITRVTGFSDATRDRRLRDQLALGSIIETDGVRTGKQGQPAHRFTLSDRGKQLLLPATTLLTENKLLVPHKPKRSRR